MSKCEWCIGIEETCLYDKNAAKLLRDGVSKRGVWETTRLALEGWGEILPNCRRVESGTPASNVVFEASKMIK